MGIGTNMGKLSKRPEQNGRKTSVTRFAKVGADFTLQTEHNPCAAGNL